MGGAVGGGGNSAIDAAKFLCNCVNCTVLPRAVKYASGKNVNQFLIRFLSRTRFFYRKRS